MKDDPSLALELVRYRVWTKPYSAWRAILAETGASDTDFLIALRKLHGIEIDKKADPILFVVQDTQQMRILLDEGVPSPTMMQILLTSKSMALTHEEAVEGWMNKMQGSKVE